jgi:head-tail adaptor
MPVLDRSYEEPAIGTLRWQVNICTRSQAPALNFPFGFVSGLLAGFGQPFGDAQVGIVETITVVATVHADVQAIGALTFWNTQQTDTPVTHRIRMRWQDYLDNTHVIQRTTARPSDGSSRTETFRIRRIKELAGRKRFVEIEAELENAA